MKQLLLAGFMLMCFTWAFGQPNPDSVAFTRQRNKINAMLAQRRTKYSQYDTSLTKRSGIFHMQTKGDIRRSNEILMDIVDTDDEIFIELKKLFDYRTSQLKYRKFQQQQADSNVTELEKSRLAYMNSVNALRQQADSLKMQLKTQEVSNQKRQGTYIVAIVIMLALILALLIIKRKRKA